MDIIIALSFTISSRCFLYLIFHSVDITFSNYHGLNGLNRLVKKYHADGSSVTALNLNPNLFPTSFFEIIEDYGHHYHIRCGPNQRPTSRNF
jgi:hypothetical protein